MRHDALSAKQSTVSNFAGDVDRLRSLVDELAEKARSADACLRPSGERSPEQRIRLIQAVRQRRARMFGSELFADPAWDMLLELYLDDLAGRQISVSSLCIASHVPATTALRWIAKLESEGLIARDPDSNDRRREFVRLTQRAREGMDELIGLADL